MLPSANIFNVQGKNLSCLKIFVLNSGRFCDILRLILLTYLKTIL